MQTDITSQTTIENILVNINYSNQLTTTEHLNVTQGSKVIDTTCHIQGMEHSGKGTESIGARSLNLAHHIDKNRTSLSNSKFQATAGIAATKCATDFALCTCNSKSSQMDRTIARYSDITIGRYCELFTLLRSSININQNLIASA